jgi:hypothetical protein
MYIVFILQYQNVQNNGQMIWKEQKQELLLSCLMVSSITSTLLLFLTVHSTSIGY